MSENKNTQNILQKTIDYAINNIKNGGGPFAAAVVTKDGKVYIDSNRVTDNNDPTAHAEVQVLRLALNSEIQRLRIENPEAFTLDGAILYSSCEPCPMCLGAATWAGVEKIYYTATQHDADAAGFDDAEFYKKIVNPDIIPLQMEATIASVEQDNLAAFEDGVIIKISKNDYKKENILDQKAIRLIQKSAKHLNSFDMRNVALFFIDKPCQFTVGAVLWSRVSFSSYLLDEEKEEGAKAYESLNKPLLEHFDMENSNAPFDFWVNYSQKIDY